MRESVIKRSYFSLITGALGVSAAATLLAQSLKLLTEYFEHNIFESTTSLPWLVILLPSVGITLIYFTRKYLFHGKKNKGIKEIFQTLENRKKSLPFYKVPSHYINGFLTVIFGGSTGVEVSTVVATAALGASAQRRKGIANVYRTELVCAGVAAGIATLFGSPIAGFLFAVEVISRKITKTILISCLIAAGVSFLFINLFGDEELFHNLPVTDWKMQAIPFMILLSLLAGLAGVYFTKSVIILKDKFAGIKSNFIRVNVGALLVGGALYFFPQLYGDSYHAIPELVNEATSGYSFLSFSALLILLVVLKPLAASLTLGAGGDGGVFAPSIVSGAFLGIFVAIAGNYFFDADLSVLNFALVGGAAMLSAAIHAPLTSLFLTCSLVPGGFVLFIPILIGSFIAKIFAKYLCSYTVYTYKRDVGHISVRLR